MKKIYLDNNATTQIDKEILKTLCEEDYPANPSSRHFFGRQAKKVLIESRESIANFLKVKPDSLIFTSGGTESVNMAIKGLLKEKSHIITSNIDHICVESSCRSLYKQGHELSFVNVGSYGALTKEKVEPLIKENTKLIVISAVNSETGVKTDLQAFAKLAEEKDILLFVDAIALLGKELFEIPKGVSAMAFSSHKIHGPKGVGLCYIKPGIKISPLIIGGPQEYEKRAGTENLLGIKGFAKAISVLEDKLPKATEQMQNLKNYFEKNLKDSLKDIKINGDGPRICNTSNICFDSIDAESLLIMLDQHGVLASHGSACSSGASTHSRVLLNMGIGPKKAASSIRFSLSRYTTQKEIEEALEILIKLVKQLKA